MGLLLTNPMVEQRQKLARLKDYMSQDFSPKLECNKTLEWQG